MREIAKRQGIEPDAVRKRLSRGIGLLRARLDQEHGGKRRAWLKLAIPFAGDAVVRGAVLMSVKKIAMAALVPLLIGGLWWTTADPEQPVPPTAARFSIPTS